MKKILSLAAAFGAMFYLSSCGDDDNGGVTPNPVADTVLTGYIKSDMTLTNDKIWVIDGRVFVTNGAKLTIEEGTIIKGKEGKGSAASALTIARDGLIDAEGTAENPIIFTAMTDNIKVGQKRGTNLEVTDNQQWGGVVILGSAPISPSAGTSAQIEGVSASEPLGQYGGDKPDDNQGVFKYVSIRHGGTTIDAAKGNDINGLTLGGVGSGTQISHVEIFANFDDGIEFFGGTVNVSDVLIYGVGDDALDVDQAYAGTIDNFMIYTASSTDSDEGLEIDGPEGPENSEGKFTIKNGTITSVDGGGSAADFKSEPQGTVSNVKWEGFDGGATLQIRASFNADDNCAAETDAYTNLIDGVLVFNNVKFDAFKVYDEDGKDENPDECDLPIDYQANAEDMATSSEATGATDATAFNSWTISSILDLL
ncbi:hypothetical protein [Fulvivirga sediminis]|uniref:T9SS C-terminal target domain-containing protein n=1 Tax=Fulvivirga sediminis TaxID=2803949 RepID=A0A937K1R4_9BACT|nr:hypothetical protein [Fulvivirga sediminis]MBL3657776.1 hypothetical protein [Fulvivirga sediminis]